MGKRIRLPYPYPDENCYSILCRYAVRSGGLSSNQVSSTLFGNTMPMAGFLYKPFRLSDIERWQCTGTQEIRYGEAHSCLQYFSVFLDLEDASLLRRCATGLALSSGQAKKIGRKCGLTEIRKKRLWYCPVCAAEDFRILGETYWRRIPQMPGVSYCPRHKVRLRESGLLVRDINYKIFPASYVLIHMPEPERDQQGDMFKKEFLQLSSDTRWLLENGFRISDNLTLRKLYESRAGRELREYRIYTADGKKQASFEHYLAARLLKESGRKKISPVTQKFLSTILSIEESAGSMERFICGR